MPKIAILVRPAFQIPLTTLRTRHQDTVVTVLVPDGSTPMDVYNSLVDENCTPLDVHNGWITDSGRFLDSRAAAKFLYTHGYIDTPMQSVGPETYPGQWKA